MLKVGNITRVSLKIYCLVQQRQQWKNFEDRSTFVMPKTGLACFFDSQCIWLSLVLINTQAFLLNRFRYTAAYWRENANYSYPLHLCDVSDEGDPQKRWNVSPLMVTSKSQSIIQQYGDWYTGHWWVGCYICYSKEGPHGRAVAPPSPSSLYQM